MDSTALQTSLDFKTEDMKIRFEWREYRRLNLISATRPKLVKVWIWLNDAVCEGYESKAGGCEETVFFDDARSRNEEFSRMRTGFYVTGFRKVEGPLPWIRISRKNPSFVT